MAAVEEPIATDDPQRRFCLIVNTVLERVQRTEANRAMAQAWLAELRSCFLRNLVLASERRELASGVDAEREANVLLGAVVAIMGLGRADVPAEAVWRVARRRWVARQLSPMRASSARATCA